MKRIRTTVVIVLLALLMVAGLGGCNLLNIDNLVGKWLLEGSTSTDSWAMEFKSDNTYTSDMVVSGVLVASAAGTYSKDSGAKTIAMTATSGGSGTSTVSYSFSSDYNTLYLTGSGLSNTPFIRQ